MKYCIIGAGGCGASIAAYMTKAGKDVTLIARGTHLEKMQTEGLYMETTKYGDFNVYPMKAVDEEHYKEHPDVIFLCVKGYSVESTIPLIRKIMKPETIVIPILNIYNTGGHLQEHFPEILVTDGCMYIVAERVEPGVIRQKGDIFRVVFGVRKKEEYRPELAEVATDLQDAGIDGICSDNIRRDALQKFSFVSPMAACGTYYDIQAAPMQKEGEEREFFISLVREIDQLANAMGIPFPVDIVKTNLAILSGMAPDSSTSMQRDLWAHKPAETDGLLAEPIRMGKAYGVSMDNYKKVAEKLKIEI